MRNWRVSERVLVVEGVLNWSMKLNELWRMSQKLFTPSHNDPSLHHHLTTDGMSCPERVQFNLEAQLYSHWILYGRLEWHIASSCLMAKWCNRPQELNNWNYKSYYPMDATLTRSWVDYNIIHPKPPFLRSYSTLGRINSLTTLFLCSSTMVL